MLETEPAVLLDAEAGLYVPVPPPHAATTSARLASATSKLVANAAPAATRATTTIFAFRMRRVLANANSPVAYLTMMYIPDL